MQEGLGELAAYASSNFLENQTKSLKSSHEQANCFLTLVESDSSACSMALNLAIALLLFPALRLSVGAFSRAISRMGPSLWDAANGGIGEDV